MKNNWLYIIVGLILVAFIASCDSSIPAGFWKNYQSKKIQTENNEQGPRGGIREMFWKSDVGMEFEPEKVIDFAKENGWVITDSLKVSKKDSLLITPEIEDYNYSSEVLRSKIELDIKWPYFSVYRFKTGWVMYEPGTSEATNKTGIIAIKSDGTEMYVYHFWGE